MAKLTNAQKILLEVAKGGTYDGAYAGKTYTFCIHCGADIDVDVCEDECLSQLARKELGPVWLDFEADVLKREREEREARKGETEASRFRLTRIQQERVKVDCDVCGALVSQEGLKQHQKSQRCQRRSTAVARHDKVAYAESLNRLAKA
jgi:hypothetical protein